MHTNGQGPCTGQQAGSGQGSYQVRGLCLTLKQFIALLIKRLHHTTRSYKDLLAEVTFRCVDMPYEALAMSKRFLTGATSLFMVDCAAG